MNQSDEIEALMDLGLLNRQAKVLFTLTTLGATYASTITKTLNMPRQDVYKVLTELNQAGLIEKHLTKPTRFEAIPFDSIFSILINRKNEEIIKLKFKTEKILCDFEKNRIETKYKGEDSQMILIPEREALLFKIQKAISKTEENINIISSGKPSQQGLFDMSESFIKAAERGVKIRYLINNPEPINIYPKILLKNLDNESFEIKTTQNRPVARIQIYDKKELFFTLFPSKDYAKSPALWSNNTNLIDLFLDYFEILWSNAKESDPKDIINT